MKVTFQLKTENALQPNHLMYHRITTVLFSIISIAKKEEVVLKISETQGNVLRYGENPHQKGYFFGDFEAMFTKLHGKELSYNNLLM